MVTIEREREKQGGREKDINTNSTDPLSLSVCNMNCCCWLTAGEMLLLLLLDMIQPLSLAGLHSWLADAAAVKKMHQPAANWQ